jgi:hypothetical protein
LTECPHSEPPWLFLLGWCQALPELMMPCKDGKKSAEIVNSGITVIPSVFYGNHFLNYGNLRLTVPDAANYLCTIKIIKDGK